MIELTILKSFIKDRDIYTKYIKEIRKLTLEKELKEILNLVDKYYQKYVAHTYISKDELLVYLDTNYNVTHSKEVYIEIINRIYSIETSDSIASTLIEQLIEKDCANKIVNICLPLLNGEYKPILQSIKDTISDCESVITLSKKEDPFVEDDLENLIESEVVIDGIRWRLQCLNNDLGPLRGGNLIHIYARPDTGKTTFLISEISFMASCLKDDENIIWINNEERGRKLRLRSFCGVLGASLDRISANIQQAKEIFNQRGGNRIRLYDSASVSIQDVERLIAENNTKLVVIDQADKLSFKSDGDMSNTDRLQKLYAMLRELAKKYDIPIITVGQAGATAEGKKWLQLDDMNNSKTGKPGELDTAIGIGKDGDDDDQTELMRYIHLSKNKLGEGHHGKFVVMMDTQRVRYRDV